MTKNKIPFNLQLWQTGEYKCLDASGNEVNVTATNDKTRIYLPVIQIDNNGIEEYIIQDQLYLIKK